MSIAAEKDWVPGSRARISAASPSPALRAPSPSSAFGLPQLSYQQPQKDPPHWLPALIGQQPDAEQIAAAPSVVLFASLPQAQMPANRGRKPHTSIRQKRIEV